MNFYYSRLQIDEIEEIIKNFKSEKAGNIFFEQEPLKFLDFYIQDCIMQSSRNLESAIKYFDKAHIFLKRKDDNKDENMNFVLCEDLHECNKNIRISFNDLDLKYKNIITPFNFEFISQLVALTSGFGKIYTIKEDNNKTSDEEITYLIETYTDIDDISKIDKWMTNTYEDKDFPEKPIQTDILKIKKMPFKKLLELKQYFIKVLTGKLDLVDDDFIKKYSQYITFNNQPFSIADVLQTRGAISLIYKILYLSIHFSYFQGKKKNQFLMGLEQIYQ